MSEPLTKLENIIAERKTRNSPVWSELQRTIRRNERETLAFLDPIFDILNDILRRLEVLEKIELKKID
jgi:hypothetical protein